MSRQAVIHKVVLQLEEVIDADVQVFEVPIDADIVEIDWDPKDPNGVAIWYRTLVAVPDAFPRPTKNWRFAARPTGAPFPEFWNHQVTLVRNGIAAHIFDTDGGTATWAPLH